MAFAVLIIGLVLIVAGVRNSYSALFTELKDDVPAFGVWAAAILAIGAIGFVPGLKPISRGLLFLVILVILVNNYKTIETGLRGAWNNSGSSGSSDSGTSSTASSIASFANSIDAKDPSGILGGIDSFAHSFGLNPLGQ